MSVVRYDTGVSNVGAGQCLAQFGGLDPTKYHVFFDDFDFYNPTDGETWDIILNNSGTGALADGNNGHLLFTTGTSDGDLNQIATVKENFALVAGKKMWFKVGIVDMSHATDDDCIFGLHSDDQTPLAGAPADGVYFRKDEGDTEWDFQVMASSTSIILVENVATATTGAITLGWTFDGTDTFEIYASDAKVASGTSTSFPTTELGVALTMQAGTGSPCTLTVDYVFAANER